MKQKQLSVLLVSLLALLIGSPVAAQDDAQPTPETPPADAPATPPTEGGDGGDPEPQPAAQPQPVPGQPVPGQPADGTAAPATESAEDQDDREDAEALGTTEAETLERDARSDQDDAEEGQLAPATQTEQLPWRNSLFIWDHSLSQYSVDPSGASNPYYVWTFTIRPRWYLTETVFLRARQDIEYELTDTDTYTYNRQVIFADTQLDIAKAKLLDIEGYTLQVGGRVVLPLSLASQSAEMYFGTGLFANNAYAVDGVMQGLTLTADSTFTHTFAGSNVRTTESTFGCAPPAGADPTLTNTVCDQASGVTTVADSLVMGIGASLNPIEKLSVDVSMTWLHRWGRGLSDAAFEASGMVMTLPDDLGHQRDELWFVAGVGYDFDDWINGSFGISSLTTRPNPHGYNPIFNPDTMWSLTATVTVDQLYTSLRSAPPEVQGEATQQQDEDGQAQAAAPSTARAW